MQEIIIKTEFIKLQQLLKLAGVVGQGSDAKIYIKNGMVTLNGVVVTERGKKVYHNDIVAVKDIEKFKIIKE